MNTLDEAADQYLAIRRALGYGACSTAPLLRQFVAFLNREGALFITTQLVLRWAQEKPDASSTVRARRFRAARRFAAWRSATDPRTEVPPTGMLPWRYQRPTPYIYSNDEIERIISSAALLPSPTGLRALTCSTLFGLLAVSGMRLGEALGLDRDDVQFDTAVIAIRRGKFGKSRFVPIHATTREALEDYAIKRDAIVPTPATAAFFISEPGQRLTRHSAEDNFAKVSRAIGLRPPTHGGRFGHGPRLHDMRHRFAVSTLVHWYRSGVDVEREMPKLATYLGHAHADNVYWYLQAVPELLQLASERSEAIAKGGVA